MKRLSSCVKDGWRKSGDEQGLDEFEKMLSGFTYETITSEGAEEALSAARRYMSAFIATVE